MDTGFQGMKGAEKNLRSAAYIEKFTTGETTTARRYFISSLPLGPQEIARYVRERWDVENSCHWILDEIFNEDCCLDRAGNEAANLRTLRSELPHGGREKAGVSGYQDEDDDKGWNEHKISLPRLGYNPTEVRCVSPAFMPEQ